MQATRNVC